MYDRYGVRPPLDSDQSRCLLAPDDSLRIVALEVQCCWEIFLCRNRREIIVVWMNGKKICVNKKCGVEKDNRGEGHI